MRYILKNLLISISFLFLAVSCNQGNVEIELHKKTAQKSFQIQSVKFENNQLVVEGINLEDISKINVQSLNGFNEDFAIESRKTNKVIANSLKNIAFTIDQTFSFFISSAEASSSFTVSFVPGPSSQIGDFKSDGSVGMTGNIDMASFKINNISTINLIGDGSKTLTGLVDITGGTSALVGTGTNFTSELMVGNAIQIGSEIFTIATISDDTNLTIDSNHITGVTGASAFSDTNLLSVTSADLNSYFSILGNGKVGIGTGNPKFKFTVSTTTDIEDIAEFSNASDRGLRIESNGLGQTPSLIFYSGATTRLSINPPGGCCNATRINSNGNFVFNPGGANNWSGVGFPAAADPSAKWEIDGTGGTLPFFKISSHADVNPQGDILIVDNSGDVGIGTLNPSEKLHVVGNIRVEGATDCILGSGSGATNCSSEKRLKKDIKVISKVVGKLKRIRGVSFTWNELSRSEGKPSIGVIAQEVKKVFPTAVIANPDTGFLMVDYAVLTAPLIQAVVEQDKEISLLKRQNKKLNKDVDELKSLMCEKFPHSSICNKH